MLTRCNNEMRTTFSRYAAESILLDVRVEPKEFPCVAVLFGHIMNLEELSVYRSPEEVPTYIFKISSLTLIFINF
jgi:hypothetical protein